MKKYLFILGGAFVLSFSFIPNQIVLAQGCVVCATDLNNAAIHKDESGCYCIGYGTECKFEATSTSECLGEG
jgi:hypothetical protein